MGERLVWLSAFHSQKLCRKLNDYVCQITSNSFFLWSFVLSAAINAAADNRIANVGHRFEFENVKKQNEISKRLASTRDDQLVAKQIIKGEHLANSISPSSSCSSC